MRYRREPLRAVGSALASGTGLCLASGLIAGSCVIPDRSFELERERVVCEEYCDTVMRLCSGDSAVYTDAAQCLAVCAALDPGNPGETTGNSTACRLERLNRPGFEANDCSSVGPAGNGVCGDSCEAFCELRDVACREESATDFELTTEGYCRESCPVLTDVQTYSVSPDSGGVLAYDEADTLQCRLGHLTLALARPELRSVECESSRIVQRVGNPPCQDDLSLSPQSDRQTYCRLVQHACVGDQAVYSSVAQCEAVSATFPIGMPGDTSTNSLRCRRYHAYAAFEDPQSHCPHAGPTGDGHCASPEGPQQGNCVSYCRILEQACPSIFASSFGEAGADARGSCIDDCSRLPDAGLDAFGRSPRYSATVSQPPGTLKCRTLHAVRALDARDGPECAAAVAAAGSTCDAARVVDPL